MAELTEPVKCSCCGGVSVNGGKTYCSRCYDAARQGQFEEDCKVVTDHVKENCSGDYWESIKASKKKGAYELVAFYKGMETAIEVIRSAYEERHDKD